MTKGAKTYSEEKAVTSINGIGKLRATCGRVKLDHSLIPCTKVSLEWTKDLNVSFETQTYRRKHMQ